MTFGQEAFARVAFPSQLLVFVAKLNPEFVEMFVVGSVYYVRQPED